MPGLVHGLANAGNIRDATGRGFIVHHADGFDLVRRIIFQTGFNGRGIGTRAPVGRQKFSVDAKLARHLAPQRRKPARFDHQNPISRRERVHKSGFPGPRSRSRIDDDRVAGLEHRLDASQDIKPELAKFRAPVVDGRLRHGRENR